jgi:carboxyl-terminal processing protease
VAYGDGAVIVVRIEDVPDALGDEVATTIARAAEGERAVGVLLDLRGNGGGSTDGAASAIGVFLPGKPSFPMLRRGGAVEVQRALTPAPTAQWTGPVAMLVDGYTASAAEMIAGALAAYGRGPLIGSRTFGKGCIQEYFDDRSGVGVLRLTTMLFSLPDGSPLQGVGLQPSMRLALTTPSEREATLTASLPPWRGPDVRVPGPEHWPTWPTHRGRVGGCRERAVCMALARLGAPAAESRTASAAPSGTPRRSGGRVGQSDRRSAAAH